MKPKLAEFDAGIKDIKSLTSNKGKLTLEYDKDQRNITLSELMEFEQALFTGYNGIEKHLTHSLIYAIREKREVFFWRGVYVGVSLANRTEIINQAVKGLYDMDDINHALENKTADLLERTLEPYLEPEDRKYLYVNRDTKDKE